MVMKKTMKSEAPIVIGNSEGEKDLFKAGFTYKAGGAIHTVIEDVTQEPNSQMRKVIVSDGATEILSVNSIKKDLKEYDSEILPVDKRYEIKEEKEDTVVIKKKKKVKKKKKTDGWWYINRSSS